MPNYTLGNWGPYKGGKPPDPPPLGAGPKGPNPRFKTVGPTDISPPEGGYQSIISTKSPFDAGQMKRVSDVKAPTTSYAKSAADMSRNLFNRGMQDTTRNTVQNAANQFTTDYQRQAEKSRSEDVLAQRQNSADRFRMDLFKNMFDEDTGVRYTEGIKDMSQYFTTEKRNEEAKRTAIVMRFLGSLL